MNLWYSLCDWTGAEFLQMTFMKNALLAVLIMAPLFGLLSTMIVTGKMSFFSDALGHSGFTGIAIGVLCGAASPMLFAVGLAVLLALLFSYVRARTNQAADTLIGVFSSTAVALGIFIARLAAAALRNSTATSSATCCPSPRRSWGCWRSCCWRWSFCGCSRPTDWCSRRCTRSLQARAASPAGGMRRFSPSASPWS